MEYLEIIDWKYFFLNEQNRNNYLTEIKKYINENFEELNDQPGAVRYNLNPIINSSYLNLFILNHYVKDCLFNYFKSKSLFIKFIRYRNPLHLSGEQELHYDWIVNDVEKRIEMFILLDDMDKNNGSIVVMKNNRIKPISAKAGSCIIMESTTLHGGSKNKNGKSRAVIDIHIGVNPQSDEQSLIRITNTNNDNKKLVYNENLD